ncbi:Telomere-associated protein RIF1 [Bienertia sinuspersici]
MELLNAEDYVFQVLESLAKLITTTRIKVVCNLGMWCISIQQLDASYLTSHFDSLLRAIVHSLDNPVGSLSITFEAIQAVMKLATQITEKMKDSSDIWAPSIYRRLLSADKRERDMCQRCLLKIKYLIVPPKLSLSKAITKDLKLELLPGMLEMLKHGKKVQASKLGDGLFVTWEGLIDALILHHVELCDDTSQASRGITQKGAFSKSLKLIMTPLIGIMTSKAGLSVHSSCLNTWCYLLHKLDSLVSDPHILGLVVEPILKVVFTIKLKDENIWMWSFCMDLFSDFIKAKCVSHGSHTLVIGKISPEITNNVSHLLEESTLKNFSVRWLPWDYNQIDFIVRTMQMIFCQAAAATLLPEMKRLVCDAALMMFRLFLKGVQIDFAKSSTTYNTVMQSVNYVMVLVKTVCDTALCTDDATDDFKLACLRSLEAVNKSLILLFWYISTGEVGCKTLQGISPINYMDMVPPIVCLTVRHLYLVVQLSRKEASFGSSLREAYNYFNGVLSLCDSLEFLRVWITIAQCLKEYIDGAKDLGLLNAQTPSTGSLSLCYFLIYPVAVCTSENSASTQNQCSSFTAPAFFTENFSLEQVTEVWTSLYSSLNAFDCETIKVRTVLQKIFVHFEWFPHSKKRYGRVYLKNLHIEKVTPEAIKCGYIESSGINNCLEFIGRFMNLVIRNNEASDNATSSIVMLCQLPSVEGSIVSLFQVLCDPLVPCLSETVINSEIIKSQLQILWKEIIRSLQRSWPTIEFDSSFLKLQATLLEKTMDHPNPAISDPTITFWNSTYGDKAHLDFPPCLLNVLDKLLRVGKLEISNRRASAAEKGSSSSDIMGSLPKNRVTATINMCSKRVKLSKNVVDGSPTKNKLSPCLKRKRSEFTEHQKEVRRAQQGKLRDCSSHGPGVRMYTSADFSQGNQEESQDSQDIRDPELILDLLKRTD